MTSVSSKHDGHLEMARTNMGLGIANYISTKLDIIRRLLCAELAYSSFGSFYVCLAISKDQNIGKYRYISN